MDNLEDFSALGIRDEEPQSSAFNVAANHVQKIADKLRSDDLLQLYGLYKQAVEGECTTVKPSWYDFRAKSKWDAWSSLKTLPHVDAKQKYINLVHQLDPAFASKPPSGPLGAKEGWVTVSTLQRTADSDSEDDDDELTVLIKAGDDTGVLRIVSEPHSKFERNFDWNRLDKDGLAYIHWATDRGCTKIITLLVQRGADVHVRDAEGQTALHYAASCGHVECVELLLQLGADVTLKDNDGLMPIDAAADNSVRLLLDGASQ